MTAGLMRVQARHTLLPLPAALVLLLLVSARTAAADRGDAFPGYKEEGAPAECKNQLADEYCEASGGEGSQRGRRRFCHSSTWASLQHSSTVVISTAGGVGYALWHSSGGGGRRQDLMVHLGVWPDHRSLLCRLQQVAA